MCQKRAHRRDHVRFAGHAPQHVFAQCILAQDLQPRHDRHGADRLVGTLRLNFERPQRFEGVAEELEPHRPLGRGRKDVQNAAAHRELAGRADYVDARVAKPVEPRLQRVPARFVTRRERERLGPKALARHHVLPQRGDRRDDDLRPPGAQIGKQGHARAAFGGRIQRPDRFVPRPHEGHAACFRFAEIVREVGERALGDVGRRHDDQHGAAQRRVHAGQQVRPRGRRRLVQRKREPPVGGCAQALDQLRQGPAARGKGADERGREDGCGVGHGPLRYHILRDYRSRRRSTETVVLRLSAVTAVTVTA